MRFRLSNLARRARNPRRKSITFRDAPPPAMLATDLYQSYRQVVALIQRHADRLSTEYERTVSALQTDSADDLTSILDQLADDLSRLALLLRPSLRSWAVRVETWQRGKWIGAALAASGVDLTTLLEPEDVRETLEATIAWNTSLVKDVGEQARQRMATAVFDGLRNRTPAREVAASIREATGMARRRSMGIASDQLSKLTSALADERRWQAGLDVWEWKHSGKLHPRVRHQHRDGHYYSDGARVGTVVDGKTVEQAPSADDLPGRPPWCGCRTLSVLVFD